MGKAWVLDTETKGTGAEMVPLEKVQKTPEPKARRRRPPARPRTRRAAPTPRRPEKFKVVDVMTRQPLVEGANARETVDSLGDVRSLVDVSIYAWDDNADRWQRLSRREERMLWRLRDRR